MPSQKTYIKCPYCNANLTHEPKDVRLNHKVECHMKYNGRNRIDKKLRFSLTHRRNHNKAAIQSDV